MMDECVEKDWMGVRVGDVTELISGQVRYNCRYALEY
jgi:hypothetical protein